MRRAAQNHANMRALEKSAQPAIIYSFLRGALPASQNQPARSENEATARNPPSTHGVFALGGIPDADCETGIFALVVRLVIFRRTRGLFFSRCQRRLALFALLVCVLSNGSLTQLLCSTHSYSKQQLFVTGDQKKKR
jgi:hypothetical protein